MRWRKKTVIREYRKEHVDNGCLGSPYWASDMKTFSNESNLWTWQNIQVGKSITWKVSLSYFPKVTTVKGLLCFFSENVLWSTYMYLCHLSSICLSLLKIHSWGHAVDTVPLLLTCFEEVFVSVLVDLYQIYNNTFIKLYYMSLPWFSDPLSYWWVYVLVYLCKYIWQVLSSGVLD